MYNAAEFVELAIRSALEQTHSSIEVVVVDDGSTDASAALVKAIQDPRVRYVFQANQGQSTAINRGVQESKGDYIKLLDADDWINPEHVACQIAALNGCMGGWMWLIPRQIWDRAGGYDPRLSLNNDFHFSIATLLASNAVCYAKDAVYSYRKGVSGALSSSYGRKAMESAFLTTDLGTRALLQREDSPRIRRIAADRFQAWLFQFYPQFPDLVKAAEARIQELGGSSVQMNGGRLLKLLQPLIGWKGVRRLQAVAYGCGWQHVLRWKAGQRKARFE